MTRRNKALIAAFWFLLACRVPLAGQKSEIARQVAEPAAKTLGGEVFGKDLDKDFAKYMEEEKKFYAEYSAVDRSYFSFFSAAEVKRPFNQLVDTAIVSIRQSDRTAFKNANNQQVVEALSRQNQALAPPERLKLELNEHVLWPDTLDVSKADGSANGSVHMSTLRDYISDAINKITYPPLHPSQAGHLQVDPTKLKFHPDLTTTPAQ
jgi:hypothetical protein